MLMHGNACVLKMLSDLVYKQQGIWEELIVKDKYIWGS